MHGVIPAAGRGTRLQPRTDSIPKGLVSVGGKPILTRCFEAVNDLGVSGIVVIVGYRGDQIIDYYGNRFDGCPIEYVFQRELRGLGNAVSLARPLVDDECIVMNGDNVFVADLHGVMERHRGSDTVGTVVTETVDWETARRTGVLEVNDSGDVVGVVEKPSDPPSQRVMTGFSVFSSVIFDALRVVKPSVRGEVELADAINVLLTADRGIEFVPLDGMRWNINTETDLKKASARLEGHCR